MKKFILLVTTLTLLLFAATLLAEDMMNKIPQVDEEQTKEMVEPVLDNAFSGYLSDVLSGEMGMDPDGNDLTQIPEKHTKSRMLTAECAKSGYGIFVKNEKDIYVFYRFNERGNDIARDEILPNTEKEHGIIVLVLGTMQKDGTIEVEAINETKLAEEMKEETKEEMKKKQAEEEIKKAEMEKQVLPELKLRKGKELAE